MIEAIILFALTWLAGLVIVVNFQTVWASTSMPQHIWNLFHRDKIYTKHDLAVASVRYATFGELWVCHVCAGQYVGFALLVATCFIPHASVPAAVLGVLSWTGVAGRGASEPTRLRHLDPGIVEAPRRSGRTLASESALPAAETATTGVTANQWVFKEPSVEAKQAVMECVQATRTPGQAVKTFHPLFTALQEQLLHPTHSPLVIEISKAFASASTGPKMAQCTTCERGDLVRHFMAHLYDAGVRAPNIPKAP